jgi:hypothetical protein
MFSLQQAANATGKLKPTIARAIKSCRLSAARNESGGYEIDPSELSRVFPYFAGDITGTLKQLVSPNGAAADPAISPGEVEGLRLLLAEREQTIRDLRTRLDAEVVERRQLIAMLVDRRPWWRRWFR